MDYMKFVEGNIEVTQEESCITLLPLMFSENEAWDKLPKLGERQRDIQNSINGLQGYEYRECNMAQLDRHRIIIGAITENLRILIDVQITEGLDQFYKDIDDFREEAAEQI